MEYSIKNSNVNINFGMKKIDKLIAEVINSPKTPRAFNTNNYKAIIEHLGYEHVRTKGSHWQYVDSVGDIITIDGKSSIVDPKAMKRLKDRLKNQHNLDINV